MAREQPSICNVRDEYIFVIGGGFTQNNLRLQYLNTCQYYSLEGKRWNLHKNLIVERAGAGSCYLNQRIFVFFGYHNSRSLNSVESLRVTSDTTYSDSDSFQQQEGWQLIIDESYGANINFTPRRWTTVCPLNSKEIIILGGYGDKKILPFEESLLIFNTQANKINGVDTISQTSTSSGRDLKDYELLRGGFMSTNNQCVLI